MKLRKLLTALAGAALIIGLTGCNNSFTLAEKLLPGESGGSGSSGKSEVLYKYVLGGYYPVYFGYDKTTSKVTDCWIIMEDVDNGNYRKYCIPSNDKVTDIQTILGAKTSWPVDTSDANYSTVTDIINSCTIYDVHYFDILFYLKNQVGEFSVTKNKQEILSLLKKNVDLELPDEIKNNDLLFLKLDFGGGTVVWDFTINKAYMLTRQDDNTALLVKESELDLITKQKSDFPDNTTVVEVPNTAQYSIYYSTESNPTYMLQKVENEAEKLYKTADGKYIIYLPLGGA